MSSAEFWIGPAGAPDRYRLVSLLGGGGEGEVWDAVLPLSAQGRSRVAVKILPARDGDEHELDLTSRLLSALHHPGLVRVIEVFSGPLMHRGRTADPRTRANYVVMDHVAGVTLREWCDENADAPAAARLRMLRTVAAALDEMHSGAATHVAVAHGDVKPANVVVRDDGGTVLVDLGLARLADGSGVAGYSAPYAAPELRSGTPVATPEADRFAFAVTTAQVLVGAPVPTGPDGWLDVPALAELLRRSPVTARRPMLVRHVLDAIHAGPEARPTRLRVWLDSAAETLSQVTTGGGSEGPAIAAQPPGPPASGPASRTAPVEGRPAGGRRRRRSRFPLVAGATVALILVAVVVAAVLTNPPGSGGSGGGSAVAAPPSQGAPGTSAAPTGTDGLPRSDRFLTESPPVERSNRTGDNGTLSTDTANVSGVQYGRAVTLDAFCTNRDGGDFSVDYDLSRSWSRFTTTVGIDDRSRSDSTATFTVLADGRPIANGPLTFGRAVPVDVPVDGVLRLRLQMNDPESVSSRCSYNGGAKVVFADPRVVP